MIRVLCLLAILFVGSGAALAEPEAGLADVPDWVSTHALSDFAGDRDGQFQQGIAYLLSDRQVRKADSGYEYFSRQAYRVVDRTGLESAATIAQLFDPTSETLDFNFVRVLRDGETTDRLPDTEITILRQEERLGSNTIDGNLTAVIQLEDIRVGDVVEYAFSGTVEYPLWPDDFFDVVPVEWHVPMAAMHYRLTVPATADITSYSVATDMQPTVSVENGWRTFELHIHDADPVRLEQSVPGDWFQSGFIVFSTMESWSEIVDWALPLFSINEPLPPDFTKRLDDIADAYPDPKERILQVLRLVQEDIRYLGIQVGLGSYIPRPPAVTLESGYGDCKDKSVLLVAALDHLGIAAEPALASLARGEALPRLPPMITGFDHVIVKIVVGDQTFWVDPTLSHQGGNLDGAAPLNYGFVLPVRQGQSQLVRTPAPVPDSPLHHIAETFELPENEEVGLRLSVEYFYRGSSADFVRLLLASTGQDQLSRQFFDYYSAVYPGLTESHPLEITDDREANVVVYRATYQIDADVFDDGELGSKLPVVASAVGNVLPRSVEADRTAPLALPYGTNARHIVRIETPGRMMILPESTSESTAGIDYARTFTSDGEAFEIDFTLVVSERIAEPLLIGAVTDLGDTVALEAEFHVFPDKAEATLARQIDLPEPVDAETDKAFMVFRSHVVKRDHIEALTSLNELLQANTEPTRLRGYLQLQRAFLLDHLGREREALAPYDEALSLFDLADAGAYFRYISALGRTENHDRAAKTFTLMLEKHPAAASEVSDGWISFMASELKRAAMDAEADELFVSLARALHEHPPENLGRLRNAFGVAILVLSKRGEVSEAERYLEHMPDPAFIAELLSDRETKAVWRALERKWGRDLSKAVPAYIAATRESARAAPSDYEALRLHLEALQMAGLDDALAYGKAYIEDWARIEAVGGDAYWFVNEYAYALSRAGKPEEAFALLRRLEDLGIRENNLVPMASNHISLLTQWGEFDTALTAIAELEALGSDLTDDYGWMWVYSAKACSLHQLARTEEAEKVLVESIMPIADKNGSAYTRALLCLDRVDEAAASIIDRLQDEETRHRVISSFIESTTPASAPPFVKELLARKREVHARPDVQKAFKKVGRVVSTGTTQVYWGSY